MPQITCKNLAVGYGGNAVLRGLDFSVSKGDYLCIVGKNGSGKSTLMKTMLDLLPPVEGEITFDSGTSRREIGYLPQQTPIQRDFPAAVREIVLSGCQSRCGMRPFYNKTEKDTAETAMIKMGISDLSNRCYRELSGGQQQRVLLARALCAARKIMIMDEPVSGLDPKATSEMYRLIAKLNRCDGMTVIMVSHDIAAAVRYASHILHIGQTVFSGKKEEYLQSDIGNGFADLAGGASDERDN